MSLPVLSVRVALANNPFDSTLSWTEIGPAAAAGPGNAGWARKITTKRGRERLLRTQAQFQAGSATVALDNRDRRFDPTNTASPYYPNVQPEKVIQVGATWSGTFYPIWTGYVDDWPQAWPGFSEAETAVTATDLFKAFALMRVLSSGYSNQVVADGAVDFWRLGDPTETTALALSALSGGQALSVLPSTGTITFGNSGAEPADPTTSVELKQAYDPTAPFGSTLSAAATGAVVTTSGFSVEVWVKLPATTAAATKVQVQVPFTISGSTYLAWVQVTTGGIGIVDVYNQISNTGGGGATVGDGNWHHCMATLSSGWVGQFYMDGLLIGSHTFAAFTTGTQFAPYLGLLNIGGVGTTADALCQDWAIYPSVLSGAQVAKHFSLGAFASQFTGQRITQLLGWLGFPASRQSVDTGHTLCQADTQPEFNTKVLDFLQKLEQTEQGQFYVSAAGNVVFQDRYHRYASPNASSQASIGDGGSSFPTEIPYAMGGVTLNFDRAELFNDISVTRRGGNPQEATNPTSVTEFTNRASPALSDLLMATDQDALYCAQWIVADTAFPQFRVGQLVIDPRVDDRWWPIVLGLDIGQVVTINKHHIPGGGPAVSLVCRIEGIEHQIDPPKGWTVTMHVSLVGTNPWLIFDDPVCGTFDAGNRWGW